MSPTGILTLADDLPPEKANIGISTQLFHEPDTDVTPAINV